MLKVDLWSSESSTESTNWVLLVVITLGRLGNPLNIEGLSSEAWMGPDLNLSTAPAIDFTVSCSGVGTLEAGFD